MPQAVQQPGQSSDADFVRSDEAARLTGESARTWRWRAERESTEAARQRRAPLAVKLAGDGGRAVWHVHRSLDARLSRFPDRATREAEQRESLAVKHPAHLVDRAFRKNHWLQTWRKLCDASDGASDTELARRVADDAKRIEGADFRISERSLFNWQRAYTRIGDDGQIAGVAGLIDGYGAAETGDGDGDGDGSRSAEAVDWFYSLYRTQNKLGVPLCHEATVREAKRRGWRWPKSVSGVYAWLEAHDDKSLTYLCRYGRDPWARKYLPHLTMNYETLQPGEYYVADHSPLDAWVLYKGRKVRPIVTAIQDLRSRCIVGWNVGPAPHQDAILAAIRMAFREWSIPSRLKIDNGKDFASQTITGVTKRQRDTLRRQLGAEWLDIVKREESLVSCVDRRWLGIVHELGVQLTYATPYSPWSKGTLERFFRTMEERFGKTLATYTGNTPRNKPDCLQQILDDGDDVPTMEEAREGFRQWLDTYNRTAHRGLGGHTPIGVWHTAVSLRRADEDALANLLEIRGPRRVGANGVTIKVGPGR